MLYYLEIKNLSNLKSESLQDFYDVKEGLYENDGSFYIGRPSILGNPFSEKRYGRVKCIEMYREYLWNAIKFNNERIKSTLIKMMKMYDRNNKLILWCYCSPKKCHGDIIRLCLEWMNVNYNSSSKYFS